MSSIKPTHQRRARLPLATRQAPSIKQRPRAFAHFNQATAADEANVFQAEAAGVGTGALPTTTALCSTVTLRIQMRRRSTESWDLILGNSERFEIEQLELKGIPALDAQLRRYSTQHEGVYFSIDFDKVASFATVVKSQTPFSNPATGKPCRVRKGGVIDLGTLDSDAIAGQMAELSEAFIKEATTTMLSECLGRTFTAHILKHRRELRHIGLDAQTAELIAETLYSATKKSIAKRIVKKLASMDGAGRIRCAEVAA
jgi:hypothetical protein